MYGIRLYRFCKTFSDGSFFGIVWIGSTNQFAKICYSVFFFEDSRELLLITQNSEAKLVVIDVNIYEEQAEIMALLKILALGNKKIEASQFRSTKNVFADLYSEEAH